MSYGVGLPSSYLGQKVAYRTILSVCVTVQSSIQPFNSPLNNCRMVMKLGVNATSPLSQFLISYYEQYQYVDRTYLWRSSPFTLFIDKSERLQQIQF